MATQLFSCFNYQKPSMVLYSEWIIMATGSHLASSAVCPCIIYRFHSDSGCNFTDTCEMQSCTFGIFMIVAVSATLSPYIYILWHKGGLCVWLFVFVVFCCSLLLFLFSCLLDEFVGFFHVWVCVCVFLGVKGVIDPKEFSFWILVVTASFYFLFLSCLIWWILLLKKLQSNTTESACVLCLLLTGHCSQRHCGQQW